MNAYLHNPVAMFVLLCGVMIVAIALYVWQQQSRGGGRLFSAFMLLMAVYVLGYAQELTSPDLPSMLYWSRIQYLGILSFPTLFLLFTIQYTGRDGWLRLRYLPFLFLVPAVLLTVKFCENDLRLIYAHTEIDYSGAIPLLAFKRGALYFVAVAYNLTVVTIGNYLLLQKRIFASSLYNSQSAILLMAASFVYLIYGIYLSGITLFPSMKHLDLNPFAYSFWGIAMFWAIFRYRMFDLVPIARDALIEIMGDGVIVLDGRTRIVDVNPAAKRIFGWDRPPVGMQADELFGIVADNNSKFDVEAVNTREIQYAADGEMHYCQVTITDIIQRAGRNIGYLVLLHDITERKQALKELRELSLVDELTGLNNRRGFNMLSGHLVNMANRMSLSAALFYLDMDKLKLINDSLGHAAGDQALKEFAEILKKSFRSTDVISRLGGDEFVILALESHGNTKEVMLQRMQQLLDDYNNALPDGRFTLSCSSGVALYDFENPRSIESLLAEADRSMYRVKTLKDVLAG